MREINANWSGVLNADNVDEVAHVIRKILGRRKLSIARAHGIDSGHAEASFESFQACDRAIRCSSDGSQLSPQLRGRGSSLRGEGICDPQRRCEGF